MVSRFPGLESRTRCTRSSSPRPSESRSTASGATRDRALAPRADRQQEQQADDRRRRRISRRPRPAFRTPRRNASPPRAPRRTSGREPSVDPLRKRAVVERRAARRSHGTRGNPPARGGWRGRRPRPHPARRHHPAGRGAAFGAREAPERPPRPGRPVGSRAPRRSGGPGRPTRRPRFVNPPVGEIARHAQGFKRTSTAANSR